MSTTLKTSSPAAKHQEPQDSAMGASDPGASEDVAGRPSFPHEALFPESTHTEEQHRRAHLSLSVLVTETPRTEPLLAPLAKPFSSPENCTLRHRPRLAPSDVRHLRPEGRCEDRRGGEGTPQSHEKSV